jgi:hypothetical protein
MVRGLGDCRGNPDGWVRDNRNNRRLCPFGADEMMAIRSRIILVKREKGHESTQVTAMMGNIKSGKCPFYP